MSAVVAGASRRLENKHPDIRLRLESPGAVSMIPSLKARYIDEGKPESIVCLSVGQQEAAVVVRKILRHPALNSHAKRICKVIRVTHTGIRLWNHTSHDEIELKWT